MSKHKRKPDHQRRNDWVRRRQNIARGMRIALYEMNQVLAPHGIQLSYPPGFVTRTISLAEGGRINASQADHAAAFPFKLEDELRARGFAVLRL